MAERLRGRRGVAQRKRRLERTDGLCEHCLEQGIVRIATVVDHKHPLAMGGSDDDQNTQNLCADCDAFKTALDSASHQAASNHPDWLKSSAIPLVIVSGPPCSGKTTYVADLADAHDIVIDLDGIQQRLDPSYRHWSDARLDSILLNRAVRVRNELLGSLHRRKSGRAWFIVSAPTQAERDWWQAQLGGEVVLLHPGAEECKRRAIARGTPLAQAGIDEWERKALARWVPDQPKRKPAIGDDGWELS